MDDATTCNKAGNTGTATVASNSKPLVSFKNEYEQKENEEVLRKTSLIQNYQKPRASILTTSQRKASHVFTLDNELQQQLQDSRSTRELKTLRRISIIPPDNDHRPSLPKPYSTTSRRRSTISVHPPLCSERATIVYGQTRFCRSRESISQNKFFASARQTSIEPRYRLAEPKSNDNPLSGDEDPFFTPSSFLRTLKVLVTTMEESQALKTLDTDTETSQTRKRRKSTFQTPLQRVSLVSNGKNERHVNNSIETVPSKRVIDRQEVERRFSQFLDLEEFNRLNMQSKDSETLSSEHSIEDSQEDVSSVSDKERDKDFKKFSEATLALEGLQEVPNREKLMRRGGVIVRTSIASVLPLKNISNVPRKESENGTSDLVFDYNWRRQFSYNKILPNLDTIENWSNDFIEEVVNKLSPDVKIHFMKFKRKRLKELYDVVWKQEGEKRRKLNDLGIFGNDVNATRVHSDLRNTWFTVRKKFISTINRRSLRDTLSLQNVIHFPDQRDRAYLADFLYDLIHKKGKIIDEDRRIEIFPVLYWDKKKNASTSFCPKIKPTYLSTNHVNENFRKRRTSDSSL